VGFFQIGLRLRLRKRRDTILRAGLGYIAGTRLTLTGASGRGWALEEAGPTYGGVGDQPSRVGPTRGRARAKSALILYNKDRGVIENLTPPN
jgi:hypothetical protein